MSQVHRFWVGALVALLVAFATGQTSAATRELRVGVYDNPPKVFFEETGQATGTFIDVLSEIAKTEGWALRFIKCQWESCLTQLEQGDIDLMPDVALTPEREVRFDFHHIAALSSWSQLYRRSTTRIESVLDLNDKRVAVLASGIQREALKNLAKALGQVECT